MTEVKTSIVIFGASGDLTSRKLIPALFNNFRKNRLPQGTSIYGFSRTPYSDDQFREKMQQTIRSSKDFRGDQWDEFARTIHYHPGNIDTGSDYSALKRRITLGGGQDGNSLYYLATAPEFYPRAISRLGENQMAREEESPGFRRIIIEKPFGTDLKSALALNSVVHKVFKESQVYRIDHYLGKETVQNLLVLRFGNAIFEPLWNRNYVDHVQITVAETVGVGHRADYYERAGVLRDMFQNHLLQLLTLVAMEPPDHYDADALRNEKVKVLRALREVPEENIQTQSVRAQYEGYRSEQGVSPTSGTPTFAALQLFVDNWRWQGVPFYLRSGKMMAQKVSELVIQFRRPPHQIFDTQTGISELFTNRLSVCIQPDEGLHLRFIAKVPDQGMMTKAVDMDFHFGESFGGILPEAYERLLLDALTGDASLFARSDEIELSWGLIDCILQGWSGESAPPLRFYPKNTWGPPESEGLLGKDGRWWIHDCGIHPG